MSSVQVTSYAPKCSKRCVGVGGRSRRDRDGGCEAGMLVETGIMINMSNQV